jgi:hypothetical protein
MKKKTKEKIENIIANIIAYGLFGLSLIAVEAMMLYPIIDTIYKL